MNTHLAFEETKSNRIESDGMESDRHPPRIPKWWEESPAHEWCWGTVLFASGQPEVSAKQQQQQQQR